MIVTCEHCAARYKLDPSRITGRGVRITCPRCKNVFVVYSSSSEEKPAAAASTAAASTAAASTAAASTAAASEPKPSAPKPSADETDDGGSTALFSRAPSPGAGGLRRAKLSADTRPAMRPDVGSLDFASVGIQAWKVKVRIGLVYDFSDYKTLARYIKDGRVGDDDQISHDGQAWTRLGDIPDLQEHFIQVYLDAKREQEAAPEPDAFDDDSPTKIIGSEAVAKALPNLLASVGPASDQDDALAAATAAAMEAEDQGEQVIGANDQGPTGPRFQDPFAKSRAQRASKPRRSRQSQAPAPGEGKRSLAMVVLGGVLLGGAGVGAWYVLRAQEPAVDAQSDADRARQVEIQAKATEKILEDQRQRVLDQIEAAMEPGEADPIVADDEDDVLIPVEPTGRRTSPSSTGSTVGSSGSQVTASSDSGGSSANGSSGSMSASTITTPADHFSAGRDSYKAGNYSDAIKGFRQAVAGAPNNADYHYWLGTALNKSGSGNDAMRELSSAASLGSVAAYKAMGDLAARQGDDAGAIGYYQSYLATNPSDASDVQQRINALTN